MGLEPLHAVSQASPRATPSGQPILHRSSPQPASLHPELLSGLGRVVRNCFLSSQGLFVCSVAASSHPGSPEALTNSVGLLGLGPQPDLRCWASPLQTHHLEPRNPARPWRHPPTACTSPSFRLPPPSPSSWSCPQLGEKPKNQQVAVHSEALVGRVLKGMKPPFLQRTPTTSPSPVGLWQ